MRKEKKKGMGLEFKTQKTKERLESMPERRQKRAYFSSSKSSHLRAQQTEDTGRGMGMGTEHTASQHAAA